MQMVQDWNEVVISVPTDRLEEAAAIAQMAAPGGLYIEDYSDLLTEAPKIAHIDLIDETLLSRARDRARIHFYLSDEQSPAEAAGYLRERLSLSQIPHVLESHLVSDADWANSWKQYFHTVRLGRRLVIRPSWEAYDPDPGDVLLSIDPGMAFGSGTHATTRLCLGALDEAVRPGQRLLDLGCGSGILMIAGVLLGAEHAVGMDIDPVAVRTASENAALNGIQPDRLTVTVGDPLQNPACVPLPDGGYDIITANIVADVLIGMRPLLARALRQGGLLIASGIIDEREEEVIRAFADAGLSTLSARREEGWVCLLVSTA